MREVTLFIAMSLDGYIADENGGVDWLNAEAPEDPGEDLYEAFIQNIDTILMGWKTYHQIVTELSPQEWPYPDQQTYVFTHREMPSSEKTAFIREDPASFVKKLKEAEGNRRKRNLDLRRSQPGGTAAERGSGRLSESHHSARSSGKRDFPVPE